MNSSNGDRPQRRPGFPIRTPSDQRLVGSSPRPIAASHVLHRPTMPRHPPCALTTQHTNTQEQSQTEKLLDKIELTEKQDARVHYPVLTQHPHTTEQTTKQQPACSTQQPVQQEQQHVCHPRHPTAHQQPTNTKKGKHLKRLIITYTRADHHHSSSLTSRCSTQKTKKPHATNTMTHDTKKK